MTSKATYQAIKSMRDYVSEHLTREERVAFWRIANWEFRKPDEQVVYWLYSAYGDPEFDLDRFVQKLRQRAKEELRTLGAQALLETRNQIRIFRVPELFTGYSKFSLLDKAVSKAAAQLQISFGEAVQRAVASYLETEVPLVKPRIRCVIAFEKPIKSWLTKTLGFSEKDYEKFRHSARLAFRNLRWHLAWVVREYYAEFFQQVLEQHGLSES